MKFYASFAYFPPPNEALLVYVTIFCMSILLNKSCSLLPVFAEPSPSSDAHKVWEECRKASKSVEVVYRNAEEEDILTVVHFKFDIDVREYAIGLLTHGY